jgi:ATP-dependent Lon protease
MGLAWTSHGGSTLYIETIQQKRRLKSKSGEPDESGSGNIEITGNIGFKNEKLSKMLEEKWVCLDRSVIKKTFSSQYY